MLFNINKNVYFVTSDKYLRLMKEGIQVYQEAHRTGFQVQPWQQAATIERHYADFPLSENAPALETCWRTWCKRQPNEELRHYEQAQLDKYMPGGGRQQPPRRLKHHNDTPAFVPEAPKSPHPTCAGTSPF